MEKHEIENHIELILRKNMEEVNPNKLPKAKNAGFNVYSESSAVSIAIDLVSFKKNILEFYPRDMTIKIMQAFTSAVIKIGKENDHFVSAYINGDQVILNFSTPSFEKDFDAFLVAIKINSAINVLMPKILIRNNCGEDFSAGIGIGSSDNNSLVRYGEKGSGEESYTTLVGESINNATRLSDLANRNGNPRILMNPLFYECLSENTEDLKIDDGVSVVYVNGERLYGSETYYSEYDE